MATIQTITLTAAGGTFNVNHLPLTQIVAINTVSSIVLANDVTIQTTGIPAAGESVVFMWFWASGNIDLNGHNFTVNGQTYTQQQLDCPAYIYLTSINGLGTGYQYYVPDITYGQSVDGGSLVDESVTLSKLEDLTSAQIIVGDGSNRPAAVAVTGDIAITNAGVTSIAAGVIVNADVNASAAIDRSKLATGTADHVVINSNTGAFSSEAQLDPVRGGNGQDFSAATGFQTWSAGTASVGAISEVITLMVSFEAAGGTSPSVGDFKIKMPYAGTVTEIYAYATKAIAGTDNGTIVPKDNGGTTMTSGTITFTASDARGTAYTSTPSANNTFAAGDLLTFTTAKTTAGGIVQLSITVTRES